MSTVGALLVGVAIAAGCTTTTQVRREPESGRAASSSAVTASSSPSPGRSTSADPGTALCPSRYAAPDPNRPRVTLAFTLAADHRTVAGVETVSFRPDRPVQNLIFRLTANTKPSVEKGNRIRVTAASATPAGGRFGFRRANAAATTQGGLLRIPLGREVGAGAVATARVAFTLALGDKAFDRVGRSGRFAFWGSGQPLLAWERGYGWHTEDLLDITAESATSEAMDTDLTVTAPAGDLVIASGDPADPPANGVTRSWHSHLAAARDVSVAAGPFAVSDTAVGSVELRVGAPSASERDKLVPEFRRAVVELAKRLGPFPFPSLSVARIPADGGGIEYPGAILMLDGSRAVAVHETAHQWFYAMVGNSQSRHPWLDEAFATESEELVDDAPSHRSDLGTEGAVDRSTQSYGEDEGAYYYFTYDKGSAALEAARLAAGASAWGTAIRCYVVKNAWRIADPDDLRAQLVHLPGALDVLRRAGALR